MNRITIDGNFCEITHCSVQFDPERYKECPCNDCTVWEDAKQQGGWIAELFARVPMMRRMTHKVADIEVLPGVPEKLMQFHAVNGAQEWNGRICMALKDAVGLVKGRHDLPVSEYIFDEVPDVMDFDWMLDHACEFVRSHCNPGKTYRFGINQIDYADVKIYAGDPLDVIVTGLTACTAAVMYACACYGVDLNLWHYDRDTGSYQCQDFKFGMR